MALAAHGYVRATYTVDCDLNVASRTLEQFLSAIASFQVQLPQDLNQLLLGPSEEPVTGNVLKAHVAYEWEEHGWFALWLDGVEFDFHLPRYTLQRSITETDEFPLPQSDSTTVVVSVHTYLNVCKFKLQYLRKKDKVDLTELWRRRMVFKDPVEWAALEDFVLSYFSGEPQKERLHGVPIVLPTARKSRVMTLIAHGVEPVTRRSVF